jgi:hypothetical protein
MFGVFKQLIMGFQRANLLALLACLFGMRTDYFI